MLDHGACNAGAPQERPRRLRAATGPAVRRRIDQRGSVVDVHAVRDLAGDLAHQRADRRDVDLDVAVVVARRDPLGTQQVQRVERPRVVESSVAAESGEACLDGLHVVPHAGGWPVEVGCVAPRDMRADLAAEAETKATVGVASQFPGYLCRDHGAAREGHGDTGAEFEPRCRGGCGRDHHPRHLARLGEQHAREACGFDVPGEGRALLPGEVSGHQVEMHGGSVPGIGIAILESRRERLDARVLTFTRRPISSPTGVGDKQVAV